jgi:predicted nucleic acid-binding protein
LIAVDTNILAYYAIHGPRNEDALSLMKADPAWAAPLLWRSEFRNLLAGYLRREGMPKDEALFAMHLASDALQGRQHPVEDEAVLDLVTHSNCSAYDCEFVALANSLGTVLVTEDKALLRSFPNVCRSLTAALSGNLART